MFKRLVTLIVFLAISLPAHIASGAPLHDLPAGEDALVTRVIDGDTIVVRVNDQQFTVRYIGIDAPETRGATAQTCLSKQATAANRALVQGKTLRLERDTSEVDKFGRLLRYAYLPDGSMVNEALVKTGFAQAVMYRPDVKYAERLATAQQVARDAKVGLWGKCAGLPMALPMPGSEVATATTAPAPAVVVGASTAGSVAPVDAWTCPATHPIKGNRNSMIYHIPTGRYYIKTKPEECFATEQDAIAAGYRAPKK